MLKQNEKGHDWHEHPIYKRLIFHLNCLFLLQTLTKSFCERVLNIYLSSIKCNDGKDWLTYLTFNSNKSQMSHLYYSFSISPKVSSHQLGEGIENVYEKCSTKWSLMKEFMRLRNGCLSSQTWQSINPIKLIAFLYKLWTSVCVWVFVYLFKQ